MLDAVVDDHILRDEVVEAVNGEVVDLRKAVSFHGDDFVPVDIACGEGGHFFRLDDRGH